MGSFGDRLQREREMRGVKLEEIAEATKIGTRSLRALEEQDFDKLPGGIFNKGFVRAYARYLGLDEEQAVSDYLAALSEAVAAGKVTRQEPTPTAAAPEIAEESEEREPLRLPLGAIAVTLLMAVAVFGGWRYIARNGLPKLRYVRAATQKQHPPTPTPVPAQPPRSGANAAKPPELTTKSASLPPPRPQADGFVVRVKAREISWVSVVADGKLMLSETLPVNAEKSVHARERLVVKTGNAAGIELFHNDKLLPPVGGGGEVKTVEFNAAGLRR